MSKTGQSSKCDLSEQEIAGLMESAAVARLGADEALDRNESARSEELIEYAEKLESEAREIAILIAKDQTGRS